ncbi:class I SAM-dependent methyltransferase [Sphingomonas albertensis]|uniref:Class I SAM-dependent methyltransferase n=1 Tax=Sphingomonas albertensis TaxID=2762591 RepID=A0ABR7ALG5_9SPHN|nr:class I SAM-dependent methyltransferase [Sphingomonas albertensis]MBC3941300.1 class I SAM-dependent methyltransferase [Sphingomonas albertensis]
MTDTGNIDRKTVDGFGEEWAAFDQTDLPADEQRRIFNDYFSVFPFAELPANAEGFDLGCGSGRWADLMAEHVGRLHCIDPSEKALGVARRRLAARGNVTFHLSGVDSIPLADGSQDFGYSLGVLHHIPDTEAALKDCVAKLKPGAPFLVYLYYRFDNKPLWFRGVWKASDQIRKVVARLPFGARKACTTALAATVYWPLTRVALGAERLGVNVDNLPLAPYRHYSFYTMRTDALDRFGTRLEQRFTRSEIKGMMERSGLIDIGFRDGVPYWVACGRKA